MENFRRGRIWNMRRQTLRNVEDHPRCFNLVWIEDLSSMRALKCKNMAMQHVNLEHDVWDIILDMLAWLMDPEVPRSG